MGAPAVNRARSPGGPTRQPLLAFALVTSLFALWGFVTANNDPLLVAMGVAFDLDYTQAFLVQIVFFLAYGLFSLPAASVSARFGTVETVVGALTVMALGCAAVAGSTKLGAFWPILVALFVLASGFTALQVAANPLMAELGPDRWRHFRLNFAQAFNSLGVVAGVHFGAHVMLTGPKNLAAGGPLDSAQRHLILAAVEHTFLVLAMILAVATALFALARHSVSAAAPRLVREEPAPMFAALRSRWAVAGSVAIGLYVGSEVAIGSIMINHLSQSAVFGLPYDRAASYLANIYWGGALVGRIIGTLLLTRVGAAWLLSLCAAVAGFLCGVVFLIGGPVGGAAALAIGLFNSIMFPTIFGLTLERSGISQNATSGLLCVAIFGGALLPLAVGGIADLFHSGAAFAIPLLAYFYIAAFAVAANRRSVISFPAKAMES